MVINNGLGEIFSANFERSVTDDNTNRIKVRSEQG